MIVEKMKAADPPIPIAFIDGPAPDEEGVWYFGASSPGSGKIGGEWTLEWVKENWDGEIDGFISTWTSDWDEDTLGRLTEFMTVIEAHDPDIVTERLPSRKHPPPGTDVMDDQGAVELRSEELQIFQ